MPKPRIDPARAIHWIVDWDGTLTQRDTLDAVVNVAHQIKPQAKVLEAWKRIVSAYYDDHASTLNTLCPNGTLPSTVLAERSLLRRLEDVERRSLARVAEEGIFKELSTSMMQDGGGRAVRSEVVRIRPGVSHFLKHIRKRIDGQDYDVDAIDVLSVNWSQHFIMGCLRATLEEVKLQGHVAPTEDSPSTKMNDSASYGVVGQHWGLARSEQLRALYTGYPEYKAKCELFDQSPFVSIYANELVLPNSLSKNLSHQIVSSADKLAYLQNLRLANPYTMHPTPVIYIGDSWTDFEALLAADLGICIRDDPVGSSQATLKGSFERLGIECPHIMEREKCGEWGVVWARGFDEIVEWTRDCLHGEGGGAN